MNGTIENPVLDVLASMQFDGPRASMAHLGKLDRKLYGKVNDVLEAIGGKWNRGAQAHVFEEDAAPLIETVVLTGTYRRSKQELGQFDTPTSVAANVVAFAGGPDLAGKRVLEPSAGVGNLAGLAIAFGARVDCVEIDAARAVKLRERIARGGDAASKASTVTVCDFLSMENPEINARYDAVVMNPPFAKQADIEHVLHASTFVRYGGRLVSVMSASVMYRTDRQSVAFRAWVDAHRGELFELPPGAFAESGTQVRACILTMII